MYTALLSFVVVVVTSVLPDLPDGVRVVVTKRGSAAASIEIFRDDNEKPVAVLTETNWEEAPDKVKPFLIQLFVKPNRIRVEIDTTGAPETAAWAENAANVVSEEYPKLYQLLYSERIQPVDSVKLVFKKMDGVAHTSGRQITISADWITNHPDDIGMVVHELIHVVQGYRKPVPGWVTEGIADYIRFFVYEKNGERTCRVNPDRAKYTDSYRTTGSFFNWIVQTHDKEFITKLNAACRHGEYHEEFFKTTTGQSLDDLWSGFIESLRTKK